MIDKIISFLEELKQDPENKKLKKNIQNKISNLLIEEVKATEQPYNFEEMKNIYGNAAFWDTIEEQVIRNTQVYLLLTEFRHLPFQLKSDYLEKIFYINYTEHESISYAVNKLNISKNLSASAFQILTYSEDLIFNRYVSRRRFTGMLNEITGLSEKETALLWDLYAEHQNTIENMIHAKKVVLLEQKLNRLEYNFTNIVKYLDKITDLLTLMAPDSDTERDVL